MGGSLLETTLFKIVLYTELSGLTLNKKTIDIYPRI